VPTSYGPAPAPSLAFYQQLAAATDQLRMNIDSNVKAATPDPIG